MIRVIYTEINQNFGDKYLLVDRAEAIFMGFNHYLINMDSIAMNHIYVADLKRFSSKAVPNKYKEIAGLVESQIAQDSIPKNPVVAVCDYEYTSSESNKNSLKEDHKNLLDLLMEGIGMSPIK